MEATAKQAGSSKRAPKQAVLDDLRERLARAQSLVLVNYRGLTVEQATGLRREFRRGGCDYRVVKNTLIRRAVAGTPFAAVEPLLRDMTGLALGYQDPGAPARIVTRAARDLSALRIKGGCFDGRALDAAGVEALSRLPGKDEARAQLLAVLVAPAQQIAAVLAAPMRDLVLVLAARAERLEQDGAAAPGGAA